ncbi:hypothetical protein NDU88_003917 [Pleurodeles waltl]|uniref:Uncharacterized protein n=1 Tax=Pleurodeles waltl TaxID=8319 RepID=A0AAV7KZV0_PLEWA|nr:hypothetical protein NDU88_003917 [Pleurodeles waltl]
MWLLLPGSSLRRRQGPVDGPFPLQAEGPVLVVDVPFSSSPGQLGGWETCGDCRKQGFCLTSCLSHCCFHACVRKNAFRLGSWRFWEGVLLGGFCFFTGRRAFLPSRYPRRRLAPASGPSRCEKFTDCKGV